MRMTTTLRKFLWTTTALATAALTLASCGGGSTASSNGLTEVNLRYTFVHTGVNAPWTYGIEKGFFREAGIKLTLDDGKGSATTAQTVASGSDDFGLVEAGTFLTLRSQGLSGTAVMAVLSKSPLAVLSPATDPITRPQQLAGAKLAITAGGAPSTLLPALLDKNGVTKSNVTMVNMQPGPKLTSLLSGRVDAVATSVVVKASLAAKGLETHALMYSDFGVATPGQYLVVSEQLLESEPELVRSFLRAAQKSIQATIANPEAAAASFAERYRDYTKAEALAELKIALPLFKSPSSHDVGWMSPEQARTGLGLLQKYDVIKEAEPVDYYLTNEYLPGQ